MNFSLKKLYKYCEENSSSRHSLLYDLERETHLKTLSPQMISGHVQGQLLSTISHMLKPERILEIGTFTGYASLCLASGLPSKGKLITIEVKPELAAISQKYFDRSAHKENIHALIGDAKTIIPELDESFDLVFIDANKKENDIIYELVLPKIKSGGFILVDNVLWSGKVVDQIKDHDTRAIDTFNKKLKDDSRIECMILPLRDGLTLARKL